MLYLICQRYKFESESQQSSIQINQIHAVFNMSKIQIWKRITTWPQRHVHTGGLYLICQRYKFESESQQAVRTRLPTNAVFNMSKIQIWKRITTHEMWIWIVLLLYLICQRYKFESESQPTDEGGADTYAVFNMSKIQIWKRITTVLFVILAHRWLYLICQRYKFESESQHIILSIQTNLSCI